MKRGLVLGKFHPLHQGHIGLIEFARKNCDELIILICASDNESISGKIRLEWLRESFYPDTNIKPVLLNYSEQELPNTSISSREVSKIWALEIKKTLPPIDIIFSSEIYGDYLADILECKHISYEPNRTSIPISASKISKNIFKNWDYLAKTAKPYFVKKVCIYGTESTGKSILTERLANYFHTAFVPEMARNIVEETNICTEKNLFQIAELQATTINKKIKIANKLLFVDTDINITCSYSKFIFDKELIVEDWIKTSNQFDLYLYLDNDAPHIQDGTRLDEQKRNQLNEYHKKELIEKKIKFELITGNWEDRFNKSINIIENLWIKE